MAPTIQAIKDAKEKVVGLKQTLRAIQQDNVIAVFWADDIDSQMTKKLYDACVEKQIPFLAAGIGQKELGRLCQIEVGASVVALTKS